MPTHPPTSDVRDVRHLPALRWTIGILVAFACCMVSGGHGGGPLGLLVAWGPIAEPGLAFLAWVPPLLLPLAARLRHRALYALGLVGLGVTWGIAFHFTEWRELLLLTSAPFLFLLAVQLRDVVVGERS